MKIDTQLTRLTNNVAPLEREQESGFDQLLELPGKGRKDDDYYWQHQTQLQQSAIRFDSLVSNAKRPIMASEDATITQEAPSAVAAVNVDTTHQSITRDSYVPASKTLSELDILQLITTIKTTLEPKGSFLEGEKTDNYSVKNSRGQTTYNQKLLPSTVFKNYQLFLNDNGAELTLNTAQLSKQQSNELQKLIKQWLTQKGYSLKLLMINGEQQ